jgi:DNA-binding transcriptional ArsR family regulator
LQNCYGFDRIILDLFAVSVEVEDGMDTGPKIAQVAALVGDPARANMLTALMDNGTLTASELAYLSGVAPQTASGHLAKLNDAGLLTLEKHGRRRYFRLASPLVGQMLEGLMVVAQDSPNRRRNLWRGGDTLRHARTCYDHMAGRVAVAIADRLVERSLIILDSDGGELTEAGRSFFGEASIDLCVSSKRRVFCRPCLDWSERRSHLAGIIGAAILRYVFERGWVTRIRDSRALVITPAGIAGFATIFSVEADPQPARRLAATVTLTPGR